MSEIDRAMLQSMAASFRGALEFSFNRHDMAKLMDRCATRPDLSQAAVAAALEAAAMKNDNFAAHLQAEAFMFLLRDVSEAARLASEVAKLFKVEAIAIRALITPAQHDALAAHVAAEVAKERAEIYARIEAMPRREELLGGQRTQYVQLHEVLAWIGAKP